MKLSGDKPNFKMNAKILDFVKIELAKKEIGNFFCQFSRFWKIEKYEEEAKQEEKQKKVLVASKPKWNKIFLAFFLGLENLKSAT